MLFQNCGENFEPSYPGDHKESHQLIIEKACTYNGDSEIPHGNTRWFYSETSGKSADSCESKRAIKWCRDGSWTNTQVKQDDEWVDVKDSSYPHQVCKDAKGIPDSGKSCTYNGDSEIPHGNTRWFYSQTSGKSGDSCESKRAAKWCIDGSWINTQVKRDGKWVNARAESYPHKICVDKYTYSYYSESWYCKDNESVRNVRCMRDIGRVYVSDSFCAGEKKPITKYTGRCLGRVVERGSNRPDEQMITWDGLGYSAANTDEKKWMVKPYDIEITGIELQTYWQKGAVADIGLFLNRRPEFPTTSGGYTELFDVNIHQALTSNPWKQNYDYSQHPLYIPANTKFRCSGSGGNSPKNLGYRKCSVKYKRYMPGQPRYRILRVPYLDAAYHNYKFKPSWYKATVNRPLKIKGFTLYDGVNDGEYSACLRWVGSTGGVKKEKCFRRAKTIDSDNRPPAFMKVDWTIPHPDMLSANCHARNRQNYFDCAFFAVVEIPKEIKPGPENIYRDYGNIPAGLLKQWCTDYIDNSIIQSQAFQLCDYKKTCADDNKQLKQKCIDVFAPASCLATGTCYDN